MTAEVQVSVTIPLGEALGIAISHATSVEYEVRAVVAGLWPASLSPAEMGKSTEILVSRL
jgi:hypothetical protein